MKMKQAFRMLLGAGLAACAQAADLDFPIPLTVREPAGLARSDEPVTTGVPFAPGRLQPGDSLSLRAGGAAVPLQTRTLALWPDGSVKWVLLDFQASLAPKGVLDLELDKGKAARLPRGIRVKESSRTLTVDTGPLQVTLNRRGFDLFSSVRIDGKEALAKPAAALEITALDGKKRDSMKDLAKDFELKVMEEGPVRTVVRAIGEIQATKEHRLGFTCWYHFYAGRKFVRAFFTMRNLAGQTITHTDQKNTPDASFQKWLSGKPGNVTVSAVDLIVPTKRAGSFVIGGDRPHAGEPGTAPAKLYQDSSASWPWQAGDGKVFDLRLRANIEWMKQNAPDGRTR